MVLNQPDGWLNLYTPKSRQEIAVYPGYIFLCEQRWLIVNWRAWFRLERLIPAATIFLAFGVQVFNLVGWVTLSLGEQIILLLIGLLVVDALTERLAVLEKIRADLKTIGARGKQVGDVLRVRDQSVSSMEDRLARARSLDIAGTGLLGLTLTYSELLAPKAKNGCHIRLLLLNPKNSELMKTTNSLVGNLPLDSHVNEVETSVKVLGDLLASSEFPSLEVRLSDFPLPHTLFIVNGNNSSGEMQVESYMHLKRPSMVPSVMIHKNEDPKWFEMFWDEFNSLWDAATPYQVIGN